MRPSVLATPYPVTLLISALGVHFNLPALVAPVAVDVTTVAHALAAMAEVPSTAVPEATMPTAVCGFCNSQLVFAALYSTQA